MNIMLDTHAFLWFLSGDAKLSDRARMEIENPCNLCLVSIASLWEIAIKSSIGKMKFVEQFETFLPKQMELNGFELLHIQIGHTAKVASLPFHHRDPFDRLLIAQCLCDSLVVLSRDVAFDDYDVKRIW